MPAGWRQHRLWSARGATAGGSRSAACTPAVTVQCMPLNPAASNVPKHERSMASGREQQLTLGTQLRPCRRA